jgi:hypothetical protein
MVPSLLAKQVLFSIWNLKQTSTGAAPNVAGRRRFAKPSRLFGIYTFKTLGETVA